MSTDALAYEQRHYSFAQLDALIDGLAAWAGAATGSDQAGCFPRRARRPRYMASSACSSPVKAARPGT